MSCNCEFSSNGDIFVSFTNNAPSELAKKSFVLNIERMYKTYLQMEKAQILQSRLRGSSKRYDFLREYISPHGQYVEEGFIFDRNISDLDYLDKVSITLAQFIILHSICKISPYDYNSIYERSTSYDEFIMNYIDYVKRWSDGKSLKLVVDDLIKIIEGNYNFLKSLLIKNISVHSVFEMYNMNISSAKSSSWEYLYIAIGILFLIFLIIAAIFIYKKVNSN
jgi:hypothetical protein